MKFRLVVSFVCLVPLFYLAMHHMFREWFGLPVPGFVAAAFHGPENGLTLAFSQFLLLLPILYVNRGYFQNGFGALARRAPNMDTLIAVGSSAAAAYGVYAIFRIGIGLSRGDFQAVGMLLMNIYFESAGMILTLVTLGKFLEARSKG